MKTCHIFYTLLLIAVTNLNAQFILEAEVRPRGEFLHGFATPFPDGADPAAFISQRTRLYAGYSMEKLNFYLSIQDIRVWGDVPQLNKSDSNGFGVHQAWGELVFNESFALRMGRQLLDYDDQRFLGSAAWAQQSRAHDLLLFKYNKNAFILHAGFAFNQDGESNLGTTLTTNTYKTMQFAWAHKEWNHFNASLLFLNNGLQFIDEVDEENNETRFSQTLGSHMIYSKSKLNLVGKLYYQFGKDINNNSLNAYLLALEGSYQFTPRTKGFLGTEYISGNDGGAPSGGDNKAFAPLYGTNHKFNGLMDYFYVGNHANNVGLWDVYLGAGFKTGENTGLVAGVHNFWSAADIAGIDSKQMATEIDIVFNYNMMKFVNLKAGYSHLFASEGIEFVKNNFDGNTNYWIWAMITIRPTLYNSANHP